MAEVDLSWGAGNKVVKQSPILAALSTPKVGRYARLHELFAQVRAAPTLNATIGGMRALLAAVAPTVAGEQVFASAGALMCRQKYPDAALPFWITELE